MNDLFSDKKINKGRQIEIDFAKCLSIIFMVFVHCLYLSYFVPNTLSVPYMLIVECILGCPFAAPVFMFCMGVGIVYSTKSKPDLMIKRGIMFILTGFIVNIGKFFIPYFFTGYFLDNWTFLDIFGGLIIFFVDIMPFAGLSFILLAIFKKFKLSLK